MRRVAALVLAAGRSRRMGGPNKLLARFDGVPLLRRSAQTALASGVASVHVVLGHREEAAREALAGLDVSMLSNPSYADGLSTSLALGFPRAGREAEGVLVMLADQPALCPAHLDALVQAFIEAPEGSIIAAASEGTRGNPVVLPVSLADAVARLTGDQGARPLLADRPVRLVEIGPAALLDVDTPEALRDAGGVIEKE